MRLRTRPVPGLRPLAVLALTAALTAGCSGERLVELALERFTDADSVTFSEDAAEIELETEDGTVRMESSADGSVVMEDDENRFEMRATEELPAAITDLVDLPAAFQAVQVVEIEEDGESIVMANGTVSGDPAALLDALEPQVRARFGEVERALFVNVHMLMGSDPGDDQVGISISLTYEDGADEGMFQVLVGGS